MCGQHVRKIIQHPAFCHISVIGVSLSCRNWHVWSIQHRAFAKRADVVTGVPGNLGAGNLFRLACHLIDFKASRLIIRCRFIPTKVPGRTRFQRNKRLELRRCVVSSLQRSWIDEHQFVQATGYRTFLIETLVIAIGLREYEQVLLGTVFGKPSIPKSLRQDRFEADVRIKHTPDRRVIFPLNTQRSLQRPSCTSVRFRLRRGRQRLPTTRLSNSRLGWSVNNSKFCRPLIS